MEMQKLKRENKELKKQLLAYKMMLTQIQNGMSLLNNRLNGSALNGLKSDSRKIEETIDAVCNHYNVPIENIYSKKRTWTTHTIPRQMVCYILMGAFDISCTDIGRALNKNHATVLHGKDKIKNYITYDNKILNDYLDIKSNLIKKGFSAHSFLI